MTLSVHNLLDEGVSAAGDKSDKGPQSSAIISYPVGNLG